MPENQDNLHIPENQDNSHIEDSPPPPPSEKMQWAFFWALLGITGLIIVGSIVVFLYSNNPWSFVLDACGIPPGKLWWRLAMHLFSINLEERKLELTWKDACRRKKQKSK